MKQLGPLLAGAVAFLIAFAFDRAGYEHAVSVGGSVALTLWVVLMLYRYFATRREEWWTR